MSLIESQNDNQPTEATENYRELCRKCRKAVTTCYCSRIEPFQAAVEFIILMHPKESKKRVGTGRLTYLCISNSRLFEGVDFSDHEGVNAILRDEAKFPVVLYPSSGAIDISAENGEGTRALSSVVPPGKQLVIFVIDGSWSCAKKVLRISSNLKTVPHIRFTPPDHARSNYRIRRQPEAICYSTVEAVHFVIQTLSQQAAARWPDHGQADVLLRVFNYMVEQQLSHVKAPGQRAVRGRR